MVGLPSYESLAIEVIEKVLLPLVEDSHRMVIKTKTAGIDLLWRDPIKDELAENSYYILNWQQRFLVALVCCLLCRHFISNLTWHCIGNVTCSSVNSSLLRQCRSTARSYLDLYYTQLLCLLHLLCSCLSISHLLQL
jgi:hypothetical protein